MTSDGFSARAIELTTHDTAQVLRFTNVVRCDEHYYRCDLTVASNGFACTRPFLFDDVALSVAIPALRTMAAGGPGHCVLKEQWDDDHVTITSNALGHVQVRGELFERAEHPELEQFLRFAFRTDPTTLTTLLAGLATLDLADSP